MTVDTLLSRLDRVRETATKHWIARCPAHDDRSPSLAIKDCNDGRILVHCFAGCDTESVLDSVGLTFSNLMPERIGREHSCGPIRIPVPARDILATLDHEALTVAIIGADFLAHKDIDEPTWERLGQAVERINTARSLAAPLRHRP